MAARILPFRITSDALWFDTPQYCETVEDKDLYTFFIRIHIGSIIRNHASITERELYTS